MLSGLPPKANSYHLFTATIELETTYSESIAAFVHHFGWQGKVFNTQKGLPKNRLLAFGVEAIITKVYKGPSWLNNTDRPGFYLAKV